MANPGDIIPYTVQVCNNGAGSATGATFTDSPPQYTTLVVGSVTSTCGSVTIGNGAGDTTIEVALGTLAPNQCCDVEFEVQIDDPLPAGVTVISNQGSIVSNETGTTPTDDPDTGADDDATDTPITGTPPELGVLKTLSHFSDPDNDGVVDIGEIVQASVIVCNEGGGTLTNVVATDPTPAGFELNVGSVMSTCTSTVTEGNAVNDEDWQVVIPSLAAAECCTITATYTVTGTGPVGGGGYSQVNDDIVVWGQNGTVTAGTTGNTWVPTPNAVTSCSGTYALNTTDAGVNWFNLPFTVTDPGMICWNVNVQTAGTWYVWGYGDGPDGMGNSFWIGTAGNPQDNVDLGGPSGDGIFQWSGQNFNATRSQITLAAGQNTICVWPREDGVCLDQLWLTTDPVATPDPTECFQETLGASTGGGLVTNTVTVTTNETTPEDGVDDIVIVDPPPCPCTVSTDLSAPCLITEPTTYSVTITGCDFNTNIDSITWYLDGTVISNSLFTTLDPLAFPAGQHTVQVVVVGAGECAGQNLLNTSVTCTFGSVAAGACVDEINCCLGRGPGSIWKEDATLMSVHPDSNCVRDEMVRQVNNNLWPNLTKWTSPFHYIPSAAAANDQNCPVDLELNTTNVNMGMSNASNDYQWFEQYAENFPLPPCSPDPEGDGHATLCEFKNTPEGRYIEYWRANGNCTDGQYGGIVCDLCSWNGRMPCDFYNPADPVCDGDLSIRDQGATATSLPLAPGMIMKYEAEDAINNGNIAAIDHGLGLSVIDNTCAFVQPACRTDGSPSRPPCTVPTCGRIAAGYRLRLPPTFNVAGIADPLTRAIAYAVQNYGFIIWDKAGAVSVRGELDTGSYWGNLLPGGVGGWNTNFKNQFPWAQLQLCSYPGQLYDFRDCGGGQNCQF